MKLDLQDFKRAFLAYELEAYFIYGDYVIRMIDAPKVSDEASAVIVEKSLKTTSIIRGLWDAFRKTNYVFEETFSTRIELLDTFRWEGKNIEELWPDLIPLFEL